MISQELQNYITVRNSQLSSDEILFVIDTARHPQINHIIYENNQWQMWDDAGSYFTFTKRNWN